MNPFCLLLVRLCAIVAGVFAGALSVCAAGPPVWQPYRETVAARVPVKVIPAQYQSQVQYAEPQLEGLPVDALTDAELDHLCAGNAYCSTESHGEAIGAFLGVDPVIGAFGNTSGNTSAQPTGWEVLPGDLIWHSYWAGAKEPRTSATLFRENNGNQSLLDVSLGGRASMFRWGHRQANGRPLGWELQIEGAAQLRLNLDHDFDFDSADFRFGIPLIYAPNEQLQWKFAYYHLSSHIGDEFLVRNPGFTRLNYSREVLVLGSSLYPAPAWRWYAEAGWAFHDDEGSEPWEFQFGVDYAQPGATGAGGTPFLALNGQLREEVDFGGNLAVQAGWLWRGQTGRILRTGLHYYNGKSPQFEFFDDSEHQIGVGLWQEY